METLIIVTHPYIEHSTINKCWIDELKKYSDRFTIHELYSKYPNGEIDVEIEHKLIESHRKVVFQFPLFNFSSPPLLKKWMDDVLVYGWAYGRKGGDKLENKKIALAVSTGIQKEDYREDGKYYYTLEEILTPFKVLFKFYCRADYKNFFSFYGSEKVPGEEYSSSKEEIDRRAISYIQFLNTL